MNHSELKNRKGERDCPQPAHGQVKQYCFTLIELLVVIAIIAILAAILMPALSSSRTRAQVSVCQNNMKELGMAVHRYADDFGGVVIPRRCYSGDYWPANLTTNKYISWKSLLCPASKESIIGPGSTVPNENYRIAWRTGAFVNKQKTYWACTQACGYAINRSYIYDFNDKPAKETLTTFAIVRQPARWLIFGEASTQKNSSYPHYMMRSSYNTSDEAGFIYPWHGGNMCNLLFGDGHVKMINAGADGWAGTELIYADGGPVGNHDWESSKLGVWYWKH